MVPSPPAIEWREVRRAVIAPPRGRMIRDKEHLTGFEPFASFEIFVNECVQNLIMAMSSAM
jgi:hypothetical protein